MLETPTGDIYGSMITPPGDSCNTIALLIADTGPTDRNGNQQIERNNSLRLLSYDLAKENIATLRYDKRGVGASRAATPATDDSGVDIYVDDVTRWTNLLHRYRNYKNIVLIGHGEGSHLAMLAINRGARATHFISVAGGGRKSSQILKDMFTTKSPQVRDVAYAIIDSLSKGYQVANVPFYLNSMFNPNMQPLLRSMMNFNPQSEIRKIEIPILVVQGDADTRVKIEDARLLHAANPDSQLVIIAAMNHIMKECNSLSVSEQILSNVNPALPIDPMLIQTIVKFLNGKL